MRSIQLLIRSTLIVVSLLMATAGLATAQGRQTEQSVLLPLPETLMEDLSPLARAQLVQARRQLQAAAAAAPLDTVQLAAAFGAMGKAAMAHDLKALAESSLENARTLEPDNTLWSYLCGVLYENQERWAEAAAAFENVLAVTADDAVARFHLGRVLARSAKGDPAPSLIARAKAQLERSAKNQAVAPAARFELAHLDNPRGTQRPPTFPDPRLSEVTALRSPAGSTQISAGQSPLDRIRTLLEEGKSALAVEEARRAVNSAPANPNARLLLGRALTVNGDRDAALAQYRELLSLDPDHRSQGLAHLRIARLLDPAKPNEPPSAEALASYRKAIELIPRFANARLGLADALMRSAQYDEAIEQLVAMTEAAPDDPASYTALSKALTRAGRHRQAHAILRQGFERLPKDPRIAYSYGRSLAISPDLALRDGAKALSLLLPLFQAQPSLAYAETIAAALATAGNFEDAVRWQSRVVEQAEKEGAKPRYLELQQRNLELYKSDKPHP